MFQETNISLAAVKVSLEAEIKQLREQLDQEHVSALLLKQKLQGIVIFLILGLCVIALFGFLVFFNIELFTEECQLNESYQSELNDLKMDKKRASFT